MGLVLAGCAGSGPAFVAIIDKEPLALEEFEASYAKANGGWEKSASSSQGERERFLDQMVKSRLKLKEATQRGWPADSTIKSEMEKYKTDIATSYMLEREIVEPQIREIYKRKTEEIRASHILIRLDPDALPADTLLAFKRAMKIIGMISPNNFDSLAVSFSDDGNAPRNKGDLGFFTTGRMEPELEDACYQMKPGEYTLTPVRSQLGYHIIKVTVRQKNKGLVRVSHIVWRFRDTANDTLGLKDTVWMIYRQLRAGADFAAAAKQHSQDPATNLKGGDLGYYERGKTTPEIDSLFYSTPVDSVTRPFTMPYGYHIFKITGYSGLRPFEEIEKDLRKAYQQTRYNSDYEYYIRNLRTRYRVYFDQVVLDRLAHSFDTTLTPSSPTWNEGLKSEFKSTVLFLCENKPFTVADFVRHVTATGEFQPVPLNPINIRQMAERMAEAKVAEANARLVPQRYPEFSKLLKDHLENILLFRIDQDEITSKIVVNDSLLKVYYDKYKEKFRWPKRVSFCEILLPSDSAAQVAYQEILKGRSIEDVAEKYTTRPGYKEKKGVWELMPDSLNYYSRYAAILPVDSIPPPFAHPDGWSIIKTLEKDSSHVKTFEEAMPELIDPYREHAAEIREQEWISELKARYPVVLRKDLLREAFKKKPVGR